MVWLFSSLGEFTYSLWVGSFVIDMSLFRRFVLYWFFILFFIFNILCGYLFYWDFLVFFLIVWNFPESRNLSSFWLFYGSLGCLVMFARFCNGYNKNRDFMTGSLDTVSISTLQVIAVIMTLMLLFCFSRVVEWILYISLFVWCLCCWHCVWLPIIICRSKQSDKR